MAGLASISGLASGIQWRDLIDEIVRVESRPVRLLENRVKASQNRSAAWGRFQSLAEALDSAAKGLADGSAFQKFTASISGLPSGTASPLTVSTGDSAVPASYELKVLEVATYEKVGSVAYSSRSVALGLEGSFYLNGEQVDILATDTLDQVVTKINSANTGATPSKVSASVLSTGTSDYRLILTSDASGSAGITLADGATGALRDLGFLNARKIQEDVQLMDGGSPATGATTLVALGAVDGETLTLGGTRGDGSTFSIGFNIGAATTIDDLVARLNSTAAESFQRNADLTTPANTATVTFVDGRLVVRDDQGGVNQLALTITENRELGGTIEFGAFAQLEQGGRPAEITDGVDAELEVDGFVAIRSSNTIDDVVEGLTFHLLSKAPATTVDLSISRNVDATAAAIESLAKAYNAIADFVATEGSVAADTRGALAGDPLLRTMRRNIWEAMETIVDPALAGAYTRLSDVGIEMGDDGRYVIDATELRDKLAADPDAAVKLFADTGRIATAVRDALEDLVKAGDGSIASVVTRLDDGVTRLNTRIDDLNARLERRRERLVRQFSAMEKALARTQGQSQWLASQISQMSSYNRA